METWYRAGGWRGRQIEPVQVVKETDKMLVVSEEYHDFVTEKIKVREKRHPKKGGYESYFKTYQEAYDYLFDRYTSRIESEENNAFSKFVETYKND